MRDSADSDFYSRYSRRFEAQSLLAIEREPVSTRILNLSPMFRDGSVPDGASLQWLQLATGAYFSRLAAAQFNNFFQELHAAQEIPIALGAGWFAAKQLQQLVGAERICVYLNINSSWGYVSPAALGGMGIDIGGAHIGIPTVKRALKEHFDFEQLGSSELHSTIRSYCHFLARAAQHQNEGRVAEAFLHLIIALDLLLGDRHELSRSISRRAAALTYGCLAMSFLDTTNLVETLYNARSKYVHQGEIPSETEWEKARTVTTEIAPCLFRLHRTSSNLERGARDRWLRELDFVCATLESGRNPTEDVLASVGVCVAGMNSTGLHELLSRRYSPLGATSSP